jgi:hypothetical protein
MEFTATAATRTTKDGAKLEVQEITFSEHVGNIFLVRPGNVWFRACGRCSGYGHYSWCRDYQSFCFDCAGSGLGVVTTREDAEKLVKSRIAAQKRAERAAFLAAWEQAIEWDAFRTDHADVIGFLAEKEERRGFIGDMARKTSALQALTSGMVAALRRIIAEDEAKQAKANEAGHFGQLGARINGITATVKNVREMPDNGFGISYLVTMETAEGHVLKTFTSGAISDVPVGESVTFNAGIKSHDEYQGRPETLLTNCRIPKKK